MEETLARIFQFTVAMTVAFGIALWFAMAVWTYRDITTRSENPMVQIFSTLVVVLGFLPGLVIYLLLRPRETLDASYQRAIEDDYLAQELNAMPVCPTCGRIIRDEYIFCPACGTEVRQACNSCGRLVDGDWAICAYCGAEQAPAVAASNGRQRTPLQRDPAGQNPPPAEPSEAEFGSSTASERRGDTGDLPTPRDNPGERRAH